MFIRCWEIILLKAQLMKPTIWIFAIEPIDTRYTGEWYDHLPKLLQENVGDKFNIRQVDGVQKNSTVTPGAFLNFSDTNYWKSSQLCNFLELHNQGLTSAHDHIIYTDAWNPTVIQLKYMKDLLGLDWKLHGLWHAGSYDPHDFLGRLVGNKPWVRNAEKGLYHAFDFNHFATKFHIELFFSELLNNGVKAENPWYEEDLEEVLSGKVPKIVRTGWPMEYMSDTLAPYKNLPKRDLILFPHRIAPEKQVDIFRDLAAHLPQYEFVVCQDQKLTKKEYHTLLGQAKMVFSASQQETLGISWFEGAVVDAIPLVPDRLSYTEMGMNEFKYPSEWTDNFEAYTFYRPNLCHKIMQLMNNYDSIVPQVREQAELLRTQYFSAHGLIDTLKC